MSRQTLTWLCVLKGNVRGCYNEWAFNGRSKMLLKGVWKMMLALEKYFWKNNKNKNTRERIYIPSLLLHCAAAGSLDVEAVAVTLRERRGSCSSSSSLSSTRQIKEIRFIEYQREQCRDVHGFTMNSNLFSVLQSSSLEESYKQHAHHSCLYP